MKKVVLMVAALALLSGCFYIKVRDNGEDRNDRSDVRPVAERAE